MRGRFVTFEGIEGVGKTTQIAHAAQWLKGQGVDCVMTREPGGTPLAETLRALVLEPREERVNVATELLLVFAARATHVQNLVVPALAAGRWVLCDRFTDATLAYQGAGRGVDRDTIMALAEVAHPGLWPDLTVVFDAPVEIALGRAAARSVASDRIEAEDEAFFGRVRRAYLEIAMREPERVHVVDAARTVDQVKAQVGGLLAVLLGTGGRQAG